MDKHVVLNPDKDLDFKRPFNLVVKQTLTVSNSHPTDAIAFKVKTTAPKQYCVRPNSGRIVPGGTTEVQVLLQAMREDPPADFKCKDKFLVQSIKIPTDLLGLDGDELAAKLQDVWARAETLKKSDPDAAAEIMCEKKLKCNFLPADPSAAAASPAAATSSLTSSPAPAAPSSVASPAASATATPAARATGSGDSDRELREARETVKRLTAACEGYKSEIERLNMVRQRRAAGGADSADSSGKQAQVVAAQSSGLNVQLVALIALIAFLLGAYLF
jgi:hypothetical protein